MPGPLAPEVLLRLSREALDRAYALSHAAHRIGFRASRPEPNLDPKVAAQRAALYKISAGLLEKDLEAELDELVKCWQDYREATKV